MKKNYITTQRETNQIRSILWRHLLLVLFLILLFVLLFVLALLLILGMLAVFFGLLLFLFLLLLRCLVRRFSVRLGLLERGQVDAAAHAVSGGRLGQSRLNPRRCLAGGKTVTRFRVLAVVALAGASEVAIGVQSLFTLVQFALASLQLLFEC